MMLHLEHIVNDAIVTVSPVYGNAWWRAFQNRLLSGAIISNMGLPLPDAFGVFVGITALIKNVLFYRLTNSLIYTAGAVVMFLLLQDGSWLCGWDMLDAVMMILLLYGIHQKYKMGYFAVLFSIFIFNRESALFIPLWLIINHYKDSRTVLRAAFMMAAGIALVFWLRTFFTVSVMEYIGTDPAHPYGNHLFLKTNLTNFFNRYLTHNKELSLVPTAVMLLYFAGLTRLKKMDTTCRKLMLFAGLIIVSVFVTGVIHESRVWLILTPVAVYIYWKCADGKSS